MTTNSKEAKPEHWSYSYETYTVFANCDNSILLLNPALEPLGYRFEEKDLQDLEKDFASIFGVDKELESKGSVFMQNHNLTVSKEFANAIQHTPGFGIDLLMSNRMNMLKQIENGTQDVHNMTVDRSESIQIAGAMQKFVDNLLLQLRLFKTGDIYCPLPLLQIVSDTRNVISRLNAAPTHFGRKGWTITKEEAEEFNRSFDPAFQIPELVSLAVNQLKLSYEIKDTSTWFVTMMTALESILNYSEEQIAHTVSRHLALLQATNRDEFDKAYASNKKMYSLRSKIVHGSGKAFGEAAIFQELEDSVRMTIKYCIREHPEKTKKQLYQHFNRLGFRD